MAGFQQLRVNREVDFTGATKVGMGGYSLGKGKTYYVSNDGADGGPGTNPNAPFLTITAAIDACTANQGDAVVVMQMSPSTPVATETWPIALDVGGMLLTGLYSRAGRISDSGFGSTPTNTHCLTVGANFVSVENLYMQVTTGSTGDVFGGLTASRYGFTLRNCWVGLQNTARYGFGVVTYDMPYLLIEDNTFSAPNATSMTSALYLGGNATFGMMRRNIIYSCSSYAIHLVNAQAFTCIDNDIRLYTDTDGFAIRAESGTNHCYFARNHVAHGLANLTNDPLFDLATDGKNAWTVNYENNEMVYPATS